MTNPPPVNHIFVDFENVQKLDLTGFGDRVVKVTLFLGVKQKRLDTTLVEQLLEQAEHVQLVRLTSAGKNALDFTLAYHLGRAVCGDPTGFFHLVSKDHGFDPLVEHLKRQQIKAERHDAFSSAVAQILGARAANLGPKKPRPPAPSPEPAPAVAAASSTNASVTVEDVWAHISQRKAHQPGTRLKLLSLLKNHFHLIGAAADAMITELAKDRLMIDTKEKVAYKL